MSMSITVYGLTDVQKSNSPSLLLMWSKFELSQTTLAEVVARWKFFGLEELSSCAKMAHPLLTGWSQSQQ